MRRTFDERHPGEDPVDRGLELRRASRDGGHPFAERLELLPRRRQVGTELGGVGAGLLDFQDILPKRFHILTALTQPIGLPRCLLRQRVHVRQLFAESVERELPSGQLVGLCQKTLETL